MKKTRIWLTVSLIALVDVLSACAADALSSEKGLYAIIDVSGGPNSLSYPITYLQSVPMGGWTDEYKTSKIVLRWIESGSFIMGSPETEFYRMPRETQHKVTLTSGFWIGIFEVTQRQWELIMRDNPSHFYDSQYYSLRPVECVSYDSIRGTVEGSAWPKSHSVDADSFIGKLRARTQLVDFDLPTEAQWEYACRAGTVTAFNNGKNQENTDDERPSTNDPSMDVLGRYWHNGGSAYRDYYQGYTAGTAKVGSYAANSFGLYDMHGNVMEWCLDWIGPYEGDVNDPIGAESGDNRILRGGGWHSWAEYCRSADAHSGPPSWESEKCGFRIAYNSKASQYYTLTFHPNGGECSERTRRVEAGDTVGTLPLATRDGYEFLGWYTALESGNCFDQDKQLETDTSLYAHWKKQIDDGKCEVRFDNNSGGLVNVVGLERVPIGSSLGTAWSISTSSDKKFLGWFTDPVGGERVSAETIVYSDVTFYAHWETRGSGKIAYFDTNGGGRSSLVSKDVDANEPIGELPVATWDGYRFLGWYSSREGGMKITETTRVPADVVWYAHWGDETLPDGGPYDEDVDGVVWRYMIKNGEAYLGNRGYGDSAISMYTSGDVLVPVSLGGCPVRDIGYFSFCLCNRITSITIPEGVRNVGEYAFTDCTRLSAITIPNSVTNIGEEAFEYCNALKTVHVEKGDVKRVRALMQDSGFDTSGVAFFENGVAGHTVDFNANGGSVDEKSRMVACGSTVGTLPVPTLAGHAFLGWFDEESDGEQLTPDSFVIEDMIVYAHWAEIVGSYQLGKFYGTKDSGVTYADWRDMMACAGKEGIPIVFVIGGKSCSYCRKVHSAFMESEEWSVPNFLYYDYDDGDQWGPAAQELSLFQYFRMPGSLSTIPAICCYWKLPDGREIKRFVSLMDRDGTYIERNSGETWGIRKGKIQELILSMYESPNILKIRFSTNGGEGEDEFRDVQAYNTIGTLPTPTRSKYKFAGWYTAATGGTKVTASTKVTADVTYYAHWTYDGSATVVVNVGSGCEGMGSVSGGKTAKAGTKLTLKATAKKGYVFAGWYLDDAIGTIASTCVSQAASYTYVVGEDDATLYAKFIPTSEDFANVTVDAKEEYVRGRAIEPIGIDVESGSLATVKVTGLPSGLKFTTKLVTTKKTTGSGKDKVTTLVTNALPNTIYGTPTKSGVSTVTVTATTAGKATETETFKLIVRAAGEAVVDAEVVLTDAIGTIASTGAVPGKVTGMGVCAKGKTLTLKAVANKGYVFAGWYQDAAETDCGRVCQAPVEGVTDYRSQTLKVAWTGEDITYYARFVSSSEDAAAVSLSINGDLGWLCAGVATSLKIDLDALSIPSVSFKNLPSGLRYNTKTGCIEGVPKGGWTYTAMKSFTATVTTSGKSKRTFIFDYYVYPIPDWAYGTFNGGSDDGQVQLSITSAGKLTGKYLADGLTYTLSAPSFADYEDDAYHANVTASWSYKENKNTVKKSETWPITVEAGEVGGVLTADEFTAGQNVWSQTSWKTFGSSYFGKSGTVKTLTGDEYGLGEGESITMTIKSNGTVTLKGTFDTGSVKNDRPVSYTATGAAVVCVTSYDPFVGQVFVYFAPNTNKNFNGYVRTIPIGED